MKQKLVVEVEIDTEFGMPSFKVGDYVLDEIEDRELTVVKILEETE
jgi:hypothetical protein